MTTPAKPRPLEAVDFLYDAIKWEEAARSTYDGMMAANATFERLHGFSRFLAFGTSESVRIAVKRDACMDLMLVSLRSLALALGSLNRSALPEWGELPMPEFPTELNADVRDLRDIVSHLSQERFDEAWSRFVKRHPDVNPLNLSHGDPAKIIIGEIFDTSIVPTLLDDMRPKLWALLEFVRKAPSGE